MSLFYETCNYVGAAYFTIDLTYVKYTERHDCVLNVMKVAIILTSLVYVAEKSVQVT